MGSNLGMRCNMPEAIPGPPQPHAAWARTEPTPAATIESSNGIEHSQDELADLPPPRLQARPSTATAVMPAEADPLPEAIGRETCPICIVDFDFEDSDDVRVLPCECKNTFHQACVRRSLVARAVQFVSDLRHGM